MHTALLVCVLAYVCVRSLKLVLHFAACFGKARPGDMKWKDKKGHDVPA